MESGLLQAAPYGTCQCGCGQPTWVPRYDNAYDGHRGGVPARWLRGHNNKPPAACPLSTKARLKHFREQRKERIAAYGARYYEANKDLIRDKARALPPEKKAVIAQRRKSQRETQREAYKARERLSGHRRRGASKRSPNDAEYVAILLRDPCCYCGATAWSGAKPPEIDHIVPLVVESDGTWENMTASCLRCNRRKHQYSLLTFLLRRNA